METPYLAWSENRAAEKPAFRLMQKISICQGSRGTKAQRAVDINSQEAQHLQLGQQPRVDMGGFHSHGGTQ